MYRNEWLRWEENYKFAVLSTEETVMIWPGVFGAHLACKQQSSPFFAINFCQYVSLI